MRGEDDPMSKSSEKGTAGGVREGLEREEESPEAAMKFQPLRRGSATKNPGEQSPDWSAVAERWAERILKLPADANPENLLQSS